MAPSENTEQPKPADPQERIQAVCKLGEEQDVESIELLVTALQDKDREVQREAAFSLAKIGDERALKPLTELMDYWRTDEAVAAAKALAGFSTAAVKPLTQALTSSSSVARGAVAQALGVEALIAAIAGSRSEVQKVAASFLGISRDLSAVDPLVTALIRDRQTATYALGDLGDRRVENVLIGLLDDKDEFVQDAAASSLGKIRSQAAVELLIAALRKGNPNLREAAAFALGQIQNARAIEPLVASLKSGGRSVPEAILKFGDLAVEPLLIATKDRNAWARKSSVELLGKLKVSRAATALEDALRDKDASVRQAAAEALELIGWQPQTNLQRAWLYAARSEWDKAVPLAKDAIKPLVFALKHTEVYRMQAIMQALGKIGDARAIVPLLKIYQEDKNIFMQISAAETLQSLGYQKADPVKPLVEGLESSDPEIRRVAAERLGSMGNIRAVEPLIEQLKFSEPEARQKAAQILKGLKDKRAIQPLLEVLKQDPDFLVREAAIQTLESLDSHELESLRLEIPARTYKRFPLDVLLVSGHMHEGASTSYGLHKHLNRHPAVRSYGIANEEEQAMGFVRAGLVNTIFIDPCFPGETFGDSEPFIAKIREEFPDIVFVLYADSDCLDRFCSIYPRYHHYFHLDHIFGYQEGDQQYPRAEAVDEILKRCEEWHRTRYEYDVCISFAGEDRNYAEEIADVLKKEGTRVFYDADEAANLLGKNLYTLLHTVYSERCRFCVILISKTYVSKMWTTHERIAAEERVLQERDQEYILPVRLDDTPLPGLPDTIAYVDISKGAAQIANLIVQKLWLRENAPKYYIGRSLY